MVITVDLEKLKEIQEELDELQDGDVISVIDENNEMKFAIVNQEYFSMFQNLADMVLNPPKVNVNQLGIANLSYEEYENIKEQVLDALERYLMPKPENLN